MGAWGYKALESDEGLDVVDFLQNTLPKDFHFELSKMISEMKDEGLLGKTLKDIDFLYDHSVMALAELYFQFKDNGKLDYENEEDATKSLANIRSFTADKVSLDYLLRQLKDIKNEVPDEDGIREIVELWKDSENWKKWETHLHHLIQRITEEIDLLENQA